FGVLRPIEAFPRAKAAAQKALALDNSLGEAYGSLGACGFYYDWDWAASERAFRRCLDIRPEYVNAYGWYASLLAVIGRFEEAIQVARRATEIDPLSVNAAYYLGLVLYFSRRHDEAITALRQALEIDPSYQMAYIPLALAYVAKSQLLDAIDSAETGDSMAQHRNPFFIAMKGYVYALADCQNDANRMLDELRAIRGRYVPSWLFALVHEGIGDVENWRKMMQASFEERDYALVFLKCGPLYDAVRSDPFFDELVRKVGLP